jgi:pyruvate ferredoxin oxidoreductase gamma subunit
MIAFMQISSELRRMGVRRVARMFCSGDLRQLTPVNCTRGSFDRRQASHPARRGASLRRKGADTMFQVRIHGRGGQGVVTGAEMLSIAAFLGGRHAQAFPSFGSERTGAPVVAFCRIADTPIRLREPVMAPDALIIQDPTLLHQVDLFSGLQPDGCILINTAKSFDALGLADFVKGFRHERLLTVPATELAMRHVGRPLPNAALLGAFAALGGPVTMEAVNAAIERKFGGAVAQANIAAAAHAYEIVLHERAQARAEAHHA